MGDAGSKKKKERNFSWIAKRGVKFIDQLRVTLRCDNEPAIDAFAKKLTQARQEGRQTVPERPPVGESCGGTRGRPGQNTEGCAGASHWDQGPACARTLRWLVPSAAMQRHRCADCMDERTTHRSCPPSQQEEESGNRDSILECLLACCTRRQRQWSSPSQGWRSRHVQQTSRNFSSETGRGSNTRNTSWSVVSGWQ